MSDIDKARKHEALISRLVSDTGITRAEALNLIKMLGIDWPSLVREARLLKLQQGKAGDGKGCC